MGDNWISVKDRFPENDEKVIAYHCNAGSIIAYFHSYNGSWHYDYYSNITADEISHWMPLPEKPQ